MSPRDWRIRIHDILNAVRAIESYTSGMSFAEFAADPRTIDAVIRNLTVIGEAANHVPEEVCLQYDEIPWQEMKSIRNVVVHEYFGVSSRIVWDTANIDLPRIIPLLERILEPGSSPR